MARVRLPGGLLTLDQVDALANAAIETAQPQLHLTARGNTELRGVRDPEALTARLDAAGLLPAASHERVRNVVISPMAGLDKEGHWPAGPAAAELADAPQIVRELDAAIVAEPRLAGLSGRFLFGIDDGRGDILALQPDVAAVLLDEDQPADGGDRADGGVAPLARILLGAGGDGPTVRLPDVPAALVAAALAFLEVADEQTAGAAWRVDDLPDRGAAAAALRAAVERAAPTYDATAPTPDPAPGVGPPPGLHFNPHGSVTVRVTLPLGSASAEAWFTAAECARAGDGLVRTTPWRGLVIAGLSPDDAVDAFGRFDTLGLAVDPGDPWVRLGACTGLPGCASAIADVRADATRLHAQIVRSLLADGTQEELLGEREEHLRQLPLYVSGCERRCGHPRTDHVEAVATVPDDGGAPVYQVRRTGSPDPGPTPLPPKVILCGEIHSSFSERRRKV
nr:hypothetical protein [Kineosphaera limosa]